MSNLIPKLKRDGGGGWETPWYCDSKPNWLMKVEHDEDKNETMIKIVHNTPTHVAVPRYIGDEKWLRHITESNIHHPVFVCPICKRKSTVNNFRGLWDMLAQWNIDMSLKNSTRVIIAPELTTGELTKLLRGDYR
jgi:hypothetical protein